MEPETLKIDLDDGEHVTALLYRATRKPVGWTIILGPGAGGNQMSPFLRLFASGLADRGLDVLTFNFLYQERGRSAPDHKTKLEACYAAVIDKAMVLPRLRRNRLAIGGKSMGGRIASQVAAAARDDPPGHSSRRSGTKTTRPTPASYPVAALVFLGYPLHPPGKPEQLRDVHLAEVRAPMLFVQGTRDPFGSPEELHAVIRKHRLTATLHPVAGGDHSFKVPKSVASQGDIFESVMDRIKEWLLQLDLDNPD